MAIKEKLTEPEFHKNIQRLRRERTKWHSKQVLINSDGPYGKCQAVPIEDYYRDLLAEKDYYSLKRVADRKLLISNRDKSTHIIPRRSKNSKDLFGYHEPAFACLHNAKGKLVRPRHVIRLIRNYSKPRRKRQDIDRNAASQMFAEFTITKSEALHLLRIVESSSRLTVMTHHDAPRKNWFFYLSCHAWNITGHHVMVISPSGKEFHELRHKCDIETYSFEKMSSMIEPLTLSQYVDA